jgi:hypothetical protein
MLVILGDGDYSEGILNIPLDNCATWACLYDLVVDIVDCYVFNSRPGVGYTLFKALSRGPGEVVDAAPSPIVLGD